MCFDVYSKENWWKQGEKKWQNIPSLFTLLMYELWGAVRKKTELSGHFQIMEIPPYPLVLENTQYAVTVGLIKCSIYFKAKLDPGDREPTDSWDSNLSEPREALGK